MTTLSTLPTGWKLRDHKWRISRNAGAVEAWSLEFVHVNMSTFSPPDVCQQT